MDSDSSSGFSSDEDGASLPSASLPSAAAPGAPAHVVRVDVIDEPAALEAPEAALSALQPCCQALLRPLLGSARLVFRYEQFTAALAHLGEHWAGEAGENEAQEGEKAVKSARFALFGRFHRAFPLTWELFAQWVDDADSIQDKRRLLELAASDYSSMALALHRLRFLAGETEQETLELLDLGGS